MREKVRKILVECEQNESRINKIFKMGDRQQNQLIQLNNALEKAKNDIILISKSKNDFISGLSYELRTSLTAILGYALLLQYITQKLVESMNGEIGVINNNEKGCCFWVELDNAKISPK